MAPPAAYALAILDLAARWNVPEQILTEGSGVSRASLSAPGARLDALAMLRIARRALELTNEPGLALHYGATIPITTHGVLGVAMLTAPTLRAALELLCEFSALRFDHVRFEVRDPGSLEIEVGDVELRDHVVLALVVHLDHALRSITAGALEIAIDVALPEPACFERLRHLVPGACAFARAKTRLRFPPESLAAPLRFAEAVAARQARQLCESEREIEANARSLSRIRSLIADPAGGFRSLEDVAGQMSISPRTLKRTLASKGTTFSVLVLQVRRARALELVAGRSELDEIARELGYRDRGTFTRAFRRWTGHAPGTYRHR